MRTATASDVCRRIRIEIGGAVQGVGYRPLVWRLARDLGVSGWVANDAAGLQIEAEGPESALAALVDALGHDAPPNAMPLAPRTQWIPVTASTGFVVHPSGSEGPHTAAVLPDLATCPECVAEIRTPGARRYRYPFTTCTRCGPRFSILTALPWDRARTTMAGFALCADCRREYADPADRRFRAEALACPACGPRLALWNERGSVLARDDDALRDAARALAAGRIVAVKGLGGFQLMADARIAATIARLRAVKHRREKPFAVMFADPAMVRSSCLPSDLESALLASAQAPIVLVRRRPGRSPLAAGVAPGSPLVGAMLPTTPMHHLLLGELGFPVIATSGNRAEEPIAIDETDALDRLRGVADLWLVHDRPIARPVDDSVARIVAGGTMLLRRARGWAPLPVRTRTGERIILAAGGHQKNTVALAAGGTITLSQHVGDLDTPPARAAAQAAAGTLLDLWSAVPEAVACDLHPDYASSRWAAERGLPVIRVQHHAAHAYAALAEHGELAESLAVVWDGTGLGSDGTIWGGEFLRVRAGGGWSRVAHLRPFRLPGGDAAAREGWRAALGVLHEIQGRDLDPWSHLPPFRAAPPVAVRMVLAMLSRGTQSPVSTSAGRLFDAAASLLDLAQHSDFEGASAMAVEFASERHGASTDGYTMPVLGDREPWVVDWEPAIRAMLADRAAGTGVPTCAARFHAGLIGAIVAVARRAGLPPVALTGGCFQNAVLVEGAVTALRSTGFRPLPPGLVPPNDGGLALGQAAAAGAAG